MKYNRTMIFLSSILSFLLVALYPLVKILVQIKKIQNIYFSFGVIFYFLIMIFVFIFDLFTILYFIRYIIKNNIKHKVLWIILILLFNILIIPYFYIKNIDKEKKIIFNTILYIVPIIIYLIAFSFGLHVYNDLNIKRIEEQRIKDSTRNVYSTKDEKTEFTFGYGYEKKDIGEYDLYVINDDKSIVFSVFTYNTIDYEQKTVEEYLNKGIEDLKKNKKNFVEISKKKVIKEKDYTITTVSYEGESEVEIDKKVSKSDCIYKLSTITYGDNQDYIIYVIEVVTKYNYETYKSELSDILKTVLIKN